MGAPEPRDVEWMGFRKTDSSGWELLPQELLLQVTIDVLKLEDAEDDPPTLRLCRKGGPWSGALRAVCHRWNTFHDANLTWLRVEVYSTEVYRPTKYAYEETKGWTTWMEDEFLRVLSHRYPTLTSVDCWYGLTSKGLALLGSLKTLTSLSLEHCSRVTDT
eukprot:694165-Pyramimonas_sp.AAC.1